MNQRKIIWFAIAFSTVIYFGVVYTIMPNPPLPFAESLRSTITLTMYGVAFATFLAALVVPGLTKAAPQQKMVMTLAMFEACAIMGLLAAFMQKDWRLYIPTWIVALFGFVREFPQDDVSSPA